MLPVYTRAKIPGTRSRNGIFGFLMMFYRQIAKHDVTMLGGIAGGKVSNLLNNKKVRQPAKPWTSVRFRAQPPYYFYIIQQDRIVSIFIKRGWLSRKTTLPPGNA